MKCLKFTRQRRNDWSGNRALHTYTQIAVTTIKDCFILVFMLINEAWFLISIKIT